MGIYVINGLPESGKSTFCQMVIDITTSNYGIELSTVDKVKEIATQCGWDGTKNLVNRKFLSDLKNLLTQWNDVPIKDVELNIKRFYADFDYFGISHDDTAIFINCREPLEIERLKQKFNAKTILVYKPDRVGKETSNLADSGVFNYDYDLTITNDGTLYDLALKALDFVDKEELHMDYNRNLQIDFSGKISYY